MVTRYWFHNYFGFVILSILLAPLLASPAYGQDKNLLGFVTEIVNNQLLVHLNFQQELANADTATDLQPRLLEIRFRWDKGLLGYVSAVAGQAAIDADKPLALANTQDVAELPGWVEGRFILLNAGNTNRIGPGDLVVVTFDIVNAGGTALLWNQEHSVFAPKEANDILTPISATLSIPASIVVQASEPDHEGTIAWNVDQAGAPEAVKLGHVIPDPYKEGGLNQYAYYYLASRDYGGIDPASPGALRGIGTTLNGFPSFAQALQDAVLDETAVTVRFGAMTLGMDLEGQDWSLLEGVETRYYTGGEFEIDIDAEPMVKGPMPKMAMRIDYHDAANIFDDQISGVTEYLPLEGVLNVSADGSATAQTLAEAFLQDLSASPQGLRLVFDSIQPAGQTEYGPINGRWGAFFTTAQGHLEMSMPTGTIPPTTTTLEPTTTTTTLEATTTTTTLEATTTTTTLEPTTTTTTLEPTTTTTTLEPTTTTTMLEATTTTTTLEPTTTTTIPGSAGVTLQAGTGWSLLSSLIGFQTAAVFDDIAKYTSVWKWENGKWEVHLPGESPSGAYATSKGFSQLYDINPGEGFWVNSKSAQEISINGTPVYGSLDFTSGWALLGLKSATASSVTEITAAQTGIVSIWKWANGTWAVYLPNEGTNSGAYATSKGFGILSKINPGEGFWVNNPKM